MPHTPSSRNTPDCASFRTDVARRAPRVPRRQHHLRRPRAHTPAPAAHAGPPIASALSPPFFPAPRRPPGQPPASSASPPAPPPRCPSSTRSRVPTRLVPPLACPATNLLCPSLPASPATALGPTHIWVGRGRGSPVRSSGDPLPRCQVPRAIWRGARGTASDTRFRLAREVGGQVGDECRRQSRSWRQPDRLGRREERRSSAARATPLPAPHALAVATALTIPSGA